MNKFTKGPWTARNPLGMEGMYHIFIYDGNGKKLARVDGHVDGTCCGEHGYPDKAETIANAHLISSAPTMYEALKIVLRLLIDDKQTHDTHNGTGGYLDCLDTGLSGPISGVLGRAIAKAEGK